VRIFQFPGGETNLSEEEAREWLEENQQRLAHAVVTPPKEWRKAQFKDMWFPKQCFLRAIQFVQGSPHLPHAHYVLGEARCGGRQQHGWVEIDDVVFDGVQQEFFSRQAYYESESVYAWYRFTRRATMLLHRRQQKREGQSRSYLWDAWLGLPPASRDTPPLTVTEEMARQLSDTSSGLRKQSPRKS